MSTDFILKISEIYKEQSNYCFLNEFKKNYMYVASPEVIVRYHKLDLVANKYDLLKRWTEQQRTTTKLDLRLNVLTFAFK